MCEPVYVCNTCKHSNTFVIFLFVKIHYNAIGWGFSKDFTFMKPLPRPDCNEHMFNFGDFFSKVLLVPLKSYHGIRYFSKLCVASRVRVAGMEGWGETWGLAVGDEREKREHNFLCGDNVAAILNLH